MKTIFVMLTTTIMSIHFANAQNKAERPEMGKVCKTYRGEGIYVTTARIGPEKNNEVLIGVTGVDHQWNGKIFKAKVKKNNANFDYVIQVDGKDYHIFIYRESWSGGYSVYLKDYGSGKIEQRVAYNEWESKDCNPEHLLTEYLEQQEKK